MYVRIFQELYYVRHIASSVKRLFQIRCQVRNEITDIDNNIIKRACQLHLFEGYVNTVTDKKPCKKYSFGFR